MQFQWNGIAGMLIAELDKDSSEEDGHESDYKLPSQ